MAITCSAVGCRNNYKSFEHIQFFGFPLKNEKLTKVWVSKLNRKNFTPTRNSKLCSAHFREEDYLVRPGTYVRRLKPDAVPTIFTHIKKGLRGRKLPLLIENNTELIDSSHEEPTDNYDFSISDMLTVVVCEDSLDINNEEDQDISKTDDPLAITNIEHFYANSDHQYCLINSKTTEENVHEINHSVAEDENPVVKELRDEVKQLQEKLTVSKVDRAVQTNNTGWTDGVMLRQKIRSLQQTLRRRDVRVKNLKNVLKILKNAGQFQFAEDK